jgi:hypothetical protein
MNDNSELKSHRLAEISQFVRFIRGLAVTIPPGLFLYLQFRGVDISPIVSNVTADWLRRITLFVYYACWVVGSLHDIHRQEASYIRAPGKVEAEIKRNTVLFAALLTGGFVLLCWAGDNYRMLSLFLTAFLLINLLGWFQVERMVVPMISKSRSIFKESRDYEGWLKLEFVGRYILGKWQLYRLVSALLLSGIFVLITHLNLHPVIISFYFLLFVLFIEGWIYLRRFQLYVRFKTYKDIKSIGFDLAGPNG